MDREVKDLLMSTTMEWYEHMLSMEECRKDPRYCAKNWEKHRVFNLIEIIIKDDPYIF